MPEIRLFTNAWMDRSLAFYLACGFHEVGRRPNPHRPGWTMVDLAKAV